MNGYCRVNSGLRTGALPRAAAIILSVVCGSGIPVFAADAADAVMGRLFSTPEQRALLDRIRREKDIRREVQPEVETEVETAAAPEVVEEPEPEAPPLGDIVVNGLVMRTGGPATAWVNGYPLLNGQPTGEGVVVRASPRTGRVTLSLPAGGQSISVRPGQKIQFSGSRVLEVFEELPTNEDSATSALLDGEPADSAYLPGSVDGGSATETVPGGASGFTNVDRAAGLLRSLLSGELIGPVNRESR